MRIHKKLLILLQFDGLLEDMDLRKYYELRIDVIARCIIATFSYKIPQIQTKLCIIDRDEKCLLIEENDLVDKCIRNEIATAEVLINLARCKGTISFDDICYELSSKGYQTFVLDEKGSHYMKLLNDILSKKKIAVFIGGYRGFDHRLLLKILKLPGAKRLSLGAVPYLSSMCILIFKYILLRGAQCLGS